MMLSHELINLTTRICGCLRSSPRTPPLMSDSDSLSSSSSAVIATLETLRRSQNNVLPRSDPSDAESDDRALLQALEQLRHSRGDHHEEDSDPTSSSLSSSHIALADTLKGLRMSQAEFRLSADSNKALHNNVNAKGTNDEGAEDNPSTAASTTPASESFEPSSAGVRFGETEDAVTHTDNIDVAQSEAFAENCSRRCLLISQTT